MAYPGISCFIIFDKLDGISTESHEITISFHGKKNLVSVAEKAPRKPSGGGRSDPQRGGCGAEVSCHSHQQAGRMGSPWDLHGISIGAIPMMWEIPNKKPWFRLGGVEY